MMTVIPEIVSQYGDEIATLYQLRTVNLAAPHIRLRDLRRTFDDRVAAHFVGLSVAGRDGSGFCEAALEMPTAGAVFTAAVLAIKLKDRRKIETLMALSEALPPTQPGVQAAFGWTDREELQGMVVGLLGGQDAFRRRVGIAACGMHRVDPGLLSSRLLTEADPSLRARALRTAGEIGCGDAIADVTAAMHDNDPVCSGWAAWSAVLLGDRAEALERLIAAGVTDGPHRQRAFRLALQAMGPTAAHNLLRSLAADPSKRPPLIQASGIVGDPAYVPWLIRQMQEEKAARPACEAFVLISGMDIVQSGLDAKAPEDVDAGPNENPDDLNVAMDPDGGLPWPDVKKIEQWWAANESRFEKGTRYFMGKPVTREHCIDVLKNGYQRQRILAAHYLCLLEPGTPLFNTSAPAWRQQRLLDAM